MEILSIQQKAPISRGRHFLAHGPIDKRRSLFELFVLLILFELFDFFSGLQRKGYPGERLAEKRAAIADEIEDLGEGYCDALRVGWVKYLSSAYPPGSKRLSLELGTVQTKVVVEVDNV